MAGLASPLRLSLDPSFWRDARRHCERCRQDHLAIASVFTMDAAPAMQMREACSIRQAPVPTRRERISHIWAGGTTDTRPAGATTSDFSERSTCLLAPFDLLLGGGGGPSLSPSQDAKWFGPSGTLNNGLADKQTAARRPRFYRDGDRSWSRDPSAAPLPHCNHAI